MDAHRLLLADAEPRAAQQFREALGQQWAITSAASGSEALAEMKRQPYDVLVADLDLPQLKETQLLSRVRTKSPKTVRIVAAAESERQLMIKRALGAHQFLSKPYDSSSLKQTIERAMALDVWIDNERIRELTSRIRTLPTVPALYLDIVRLLKSPNATTTEVGELIAKDMALMAKLLQVLNSAYFGLPQTVSDPGEAVALLGFDTIKSLVLALKLLNHYDKVLPVYFSIEGLWQHSTGVARSAKELVWSYTGDQNMAEIAFAAGLLHDIGKVVLAANFDDQYCGAEALARKGQLPLSDVERDIFGATHGEIGAYLLGLWGMPMDIIEAAAFHHHPSRSGDRRFSALTAVHVANVCDHEKTAGVDGFLPPQIDEAYLGKIEVLEFLPGWRQDLGLPAGGVSKTPEALVPPACQTPEGPATASPLPNAPSQISSAADPGETVALHSVPTRMAPLRRPHTPFSSIFLASVLVFSALMLLPEFLRDVTQHAQVVRGRQSATQVAPVVSDGSSPVPANAESPSPLPEKAAVEPPNAPPDLSAESAPGAGDAPVRVVAPAEAVLPELRLQGIFLSTVPSAILNGRTLRTNDYIEGARLVAITTSNVVLEFQNKPVAISFAQHR